jgi:hypothetical protein
MNGIVTQFSGGVTEIKPSTGLVKTTNYLNWLCRNYGLEAQAIINGGGGSPITPVTPNGYIFYSFTHIISSGENGVNTYSNPILVGGKNVTSMTVNGNTYYLIANDFTFNITTGTITWNTGVFTTNDTMTINFSRLI